MVYSFGQYVNYFSRTAKLFGSRDINLQSIFCITDIQLIKTIYIIIKTILNALYGSKEPAISAIKLHFLDENRKN
jgi:hypothetical protein